LQIRLVEAAEHDDTQSKVGMQVHDNPALATDTFWQEYSHCVLHGVLLEYLV